MTDALRVGVADLDVGIDEGKEGLGLVGVDDLTVALDWGEEGLAETVDLVVDNVVGLEEVGVEDLDGLDEVVVVVGLDDIDRMGLDVVKVDLGDDEVNVGRLVGVAGLVDPGPTDAEALRSPGVLEDLVFKPGATLGCLDAKLLLATGSG